MSLVTELFESPAYKKREDYSDEGLLQHAMRMVADWQEYALRLEEAIEVYETELENREVDIYQLLDDTLQIPEEKKKKRNAEKKAEKEETAKAFNLLFSDKPMEQVERLGRCIYDYPFLDNK